MKNSHNKQTSNIPRKPFLVLASLACLPGLVALLLMLYVFLATIFPSTPDKERAIELLRYMSYLDKSLASSKLIYSKHYQDILSSNVCFVFQYQEGHYDISKSNFNYLNQNKKYQDEDFAYDYNKNMVKNEGCSKFANKLGKKEARLFVEYDYRYKSIGSGRGLKVFINKKEQLIMFEGYLYD